MSEISQDTVRLSQAWGASFGDYNYVKWDGSVKTRFDFQDLLVEISENRAVTVESEVQPLSTRIMHRNRRLDKLGSALADLTKLQSQFDSDAKGTDRKGTLKQSSYETVQEVFGNAARFDYHQVSLTLPRVDLPDLIPFWKNLLAAKERRLFSDGDLLTFNTPDDWKGFGILRKYEAMQFTRKPKDKNK